MNVPWEIREIRKTAVKIIIGVYALIATVNFIVRWIETRDVEHAVIDTAVSMIMILPVIVACIVTVMTVEPMGETIESRA